VAEKFSRDQAELIGKIILAKFLKLSLEKYEKFIHKIEGEILWGERKGIMTSKKLSGAEVMDSGDLLSSRAIGMVKKDGCSLFSIYYKHPIFTKINGNHDPSVPLFPFGRPYGFETAESDAIKQMDK